MDIGAKPFHTFLKEHGDKTWRERITKIRVTKKGGRKRKDRKQKELKRWGSKKAQHRAEGKVKRLHITGTLGAHVKRK